MINLVDTPRRELAVWMYPTRHGAEHWQLAGQALERVLLVAGGLGLQASYLNQPVQVAAVRPKLQRLRGGSGFPQILLRLDYPIATAAPSPRRPLTDVLDTP